MKKVYKLLLFLLVIPFLLTGCTKDDMEDIDIIVTNYPNEYVTKKLYSKHASVTSVYPDGVDIDNYKINKKRLKDFSKTDLFIYNGLNEKERNLALELLELNPNLKIIDSAYALETNNGILELWLNPSYLLMMAQNIHLGLDEYISSNVLKKEINENYEELKIELSELDVDYRVTIENTNDKLLVVDDKCLKYLEKFGLDVYVLPDAKDKTFNTIKDFIKEKKISNVYTFVGNKYSENLDKLLEEFKDLKVLKLHKIDNLSDKERSSKKDYVKIMTENLELIKSEIYQ